MLRMGSDNGLLIAINPLRFLAAANSGTSAKNLLAMAVSVTDQAVPNLAGFTF